MSFHKRIRKTGRDAAAVIDFTRCDKRLPSFLTFSRADAAPCATRRRVTNAVGPSRTNVLLQSQAFSSASWVKANSATVTDNATLAPDGTMTGAKLTGIGGTGVTTSDLRQQATMATSGPTTISFYAKAAELSFCALDTLGRTPTDGASETIAIFNLATGTVASSSGPGAATAKIVPANNGWYRCSITLPATASADREARIERLSQAARGQTAFTGATTDGIYVWGAQQEVGTGATPYILTSAAAVTTTDWPRTNKCTNRNANPVSVADCVFTNAANGLATFSLVNDAAALEASGLNGICTGGVVYKVDNSLGNGNASVLFPGNTGNLAPHTLSCYTRGTVATSVFTGSNAAWNANVVGGAKYTRVVGTSRTPAGGGTNLKMTVGAGDVVYFILNQLEEGSAATAVIVNEAGGAAKTVTTPPYGDLEVLAANEPRIDFSADGTARGLLVEPSRTNLAVRSNDRTAVGWNRNNVSVAPNAIPTPFGFYGDLSTRLTGVGAYLSQAPAGAIGTSGTFLFWRIAKAGPLGPRLGMRIQGTYPNRGDAVFDLTTGTVVGVSNGNTATGTAARMVHIVDGWYICAMQTTLADNFTQFIHGPCDNAATVGGWEGNSATASAIYSAYDHFQVGGSLNDIASLIPTDAAAKTRAAESCVITNLADIGWNANGWSALVEWEQDSLPVGENSVIFQAADAGNANFVQIYVSAAGNLRANVNIAGVASDFLLIAGAVAAGSMYRMAVKLAPSGFAVSINGAATVTLPTTLPLAALTSMRLCTNAALNSNMRGWLRRIKAWSRDLTQGELQLASA